MNKNNSWVIGRAAALAIAVVTIVFALSLIWEVLNYSEFAKNLGYAASLLLAISVVIMMACFYEVTQERLKKSMDYWPWFHPSSTLPSASAPIFFNYPLLRPIHLTYQAKF